MYFYFKGENDASSINTHEESRDSLHDDDKRVNNKSATLAATKEEQKTEKPKKKSKLRSFSFLKIMKSNKSNDQTH